VRRCLVFHPPRRFPVNFSALCPGFFSLLMNVPPPRKPTSKIRLRLEVLRRQDCNPSITFAVISFTRPFQLGVPFPSPPSTTFGPIGRSPPTLLLFGVVAVRFGTVGRYTTGDLVAHSAMSCAPATPAGKIGLPLSRCALFIQHILDLASSRIPCLGPCSAAAGGISKTRLTIAPA